MVKPVKPPTIAEFLRLRPIESLKIIQKREAVSPPTKKTVKPIQIKTNAETTIISWTLGRGPSEHQTMRNGAAIIQKVSVAALSVAKKPGGS